VIESYIRRADVLLLQAIADLTTRLERPPTFEEVAVEAGFASTSRGAVYRRLARLRGIYVTWDDQASRSLRLLDPAVAWVKLTPNDAPSTTAKGSQEALTILALLSTGVLRLIASREKVDSGNVYPESLRRGLNRLAVWALETGLEFPADFPDALRLVRMPVREWPFPAFPPEVDGEQPLLSQDEATDLCYELAILTGDIEEELAERAVAIARDACQAADDQQAYVRFRQFLIEHPVVTRGELVDASDGLPSEVGTLLHECYELVPDAVIRDGNIHCCDFCGWTLQWTTEGALRCGGSVCGKITSGFQRHAKIKSAGAVRGLWRRVKPGIRRYVVTPGRSELRLAHRLGKMGVEVSLWPGFDAYDLRLTFSDDQVWAIDVKDWQNPFLLAHSVRSFAETPSWDRAFWVFPDHRSRLLPRYAEAFGRAWRREHERVDYAMERTFIRLVREKLTDTGVWE
jgi:hypothetical protein